jgi:hypothetical protein
MFTVERTTVANRPGAKDGVCNACGRRFLMDPRGWKKTHVYVETEEVSAMRGDDLVRFFHPSCVEEVVPLAGGGRRVKPLAVDHQSTASLANVVPCATDDAVAKEAVAAFGSLSALHGSAVTRYFTVDGVTYRLRINRT